MDKYTRGQHPHSQANLTYRGGRPQTYEGAKKKREVTVTDRGWEGVKALIQQVGCASVSDLLEQLGRGSLHIQPPDPLEPN